MIGKTTLFSLLVVLLIVTPSLQLGVLWVNQITGNFDTKTVVVEEVVIDDNTIRVDFIDDLNGNGVDIEDVILNNGNAFVPINLDVGKVATITGELRPNGGIIADAGDQEGFSFRVEDDTGITTINGELRPNGGINVDNGVFTVEDETGETRIAQALLRPDGGINVQNGLFTVDADTGDVLTQGFSYVQRDIIIGDSNPEDRFIRRFDSSFDNGGNTIIAGQSSTNVGGDLIFEPGYGQTVGKILFGRPAGDEIRIGRIGIQGTSTFGGVTRFQGQSSTLGRGGDLYLRAGNGGSGNPGGDIYLSPGLSQGNLGTGVIYLGSDACLSAEQCNSDIELRRPTSTVTAGGATLFQGQDSTTGRGGDMIVRAGNSEFNNGGDLRLLPGTGSQDTTYGTIFIGRSNNDELRIRRPTSEDPAGPLYLQGQDSTSGNGGDIHIQAGDAGAANQNGGDIYLTTGNSGTAGVAGNIILGNVEDPVFILRPDTGAAAATSTTFRGQDSEVSNGGDLTLSSGNGGLNGGILQLFGGQGTGSGGAVAITAGDGNTAGGDVHIQGGTGTTGGDVSIVSGSGVNGGDIVLSAGLGSSNPGNIIVRNADSFIIQQADVRIVSGDLFLQLGPCPNGQRPSDCTTNAQLRISADADNYVSYFDQSAGQFVTLLRRRQIGVALPPNPASINAQNLLTSLGQVGESLFDLVNALGQCGHGLITVRGRDGGVAYPGGCIFPGPIPDITGGLAATLGLPAVQVIEH